MSAHARIFAFALVFFNCICPLSAYSSTIDSATCSRSDVVTAINTAVNGDIVLVPAGACSWSSAITVNKQITIKGAGMDASTGTRITATSGMFAIADNLNNWRISGFRHIATGSSEHSIYVGSGSSSSHTGFRIDHIYFVNPLIAVELWAKGNIYGVMDHCTIEGGTDDTKIRLYANTNGTTWTEDTNFGSSNFFFVEDCVFNNQSVEWGHVIASGSGKYVFRYNTVNMASTRIPAVVDFHGTCENPFRGTRVVEIYNNEFYSGSSFWMRGIFARGGTAVIHDNRFSGNWSGGDLMEIYEYKITECSIACNDMWYPSRCCSTYPCYDQPGRGKNGNLEPIYFWNNTPSGRNPYVDSSQATYIQLNRDYYTLAMPGYTPYIYPHPLIADSPPPLPPSNLRIVE